MELCCFLLKKNSACLYNSWGSEYCTNVVFVMSRRTILGASTKQLAAVSLVVTAWVFFIVGDARATI